MKLTNPTETVLYSIEHAIKVYRKLSQHIINTLIKDITTDQCLVLIILENNSTSSQKEIAELIFKDYASITRMIELMVKNDYLLRSPNPNDRRKFDLEITKKGNQALEVLKPKIQKNRQKALKGLSTQEIDQLEAMLQKIISNCKND